MNSKGVRSPPRQGTFALLTATASPAALVLALCHGLAGALFMQVGYYNLKITPPTLAERVLASVATVGGIVALVWLASVAWQVAATLSARSIGQRKAGGPTVVTAERWAAGQIARHTGLTIFLVVLLWLQTRLIGRGDIVVGVFTGLWFTAALCCGAFRFVAAAWTRMRGRQTATSAALLDESLMFPTADALIDVAPPTWTFLVILEGIFHMGAGTWVPIVEISALLRHMADEVAAMLLGPEAGRLGGIIGLFLLTATVWGVAWRLKSAQLARNAPARRRNLPMIWAALVVAGVLSLSLLDGRMRRVVLHHSHPSLDQVSRLLTPTLRTTLRTEEEGGAAAAARLFPHVLLANGLPNPAAAHLPASATPAVAPHKTARHALIIFVDSISRRHLEAWGYERLVAPELARLASESIRFDGIRSNASQTDLSTISLFYSLLPLPHLDKGDTYRDGHGGTPVHLRAAAAGLKVGLFSADWEVHDRGHGALYPDRCDAFIDARQADTEAAQKQIVRWAGRDEEEVVDRFLAWYPLIHGAGDRFFSYVKFLRPHAPYYTPPAGKGWQPPYEPAADGFNVFDFQPPAGRVPLLRNRYDNAIRYADQALGRLLEHMRRSGALEETALVFLTDHGEAWGEHGLFGHSTQHFEEMLEIPVLLRMPGGQPAVDDRRGSTIDVAPTLLHALGLPPDPQHQGHSLLDPRHRPRLHFAWSNNVGPMASLAIDTWKLIWMPGSGERWLFDLAKDPGERHNLAGVPSQGDHELALMHLLRRLARAQLRRFRELAPPEDVQVANQRTTE